MNKIKGLIAAPFTPISEKDEIMYDKIPAYFNFLEKNGVAGA